MDEDNDGAMQLPSFLLLTLKQVVVRLVLPARHLRRSPGGEWWRRGLGGLFVGYVWSGASAGWYLSSS
jgi:hypothetical protein